jgi:hypothetical protein
MKDLSQEANRLVVLWKSGRDKFASFFQILNEIQQEIGAAALDQWCIDNLRLHISMIERISGILRDVDAERERRSLATVRAMQRKAKLQQQAAAAAQRLEIITTRRRVFEETKQLKQAQVTEIKRVTRIRQKTVHRAERKSTLAATPPSHQRLAELLMQCQDIEKLNRIDLGRCYSEMKEIVQNNQAGRNSRDEYWNWGGWAATYIKRSRQDINRCIKEFGTSCSKTQPANVFSLRKNVN